MHPTTNGRRADLACHHRDGSIVSIIGYNITELPAYSRLDFNLSDRNYLENAQYIGMYYLRLLSREPQPLQK